MTCWIRDSGLKYYVRKSQFFPGLVELANCSADGTELFAYWRFMRKYVREVPFLAEQVLHVGLARYYERSKWLGRTDDIGVPSYLSPLAVERYRGTKYYDIFGFAEGEYSTRLQTLLEGLELC